jgi:hypothetical protein
MVEATDELRILGPLRSKPARSFGGAFRAALREIAVPHEKPRLNDHGGRRSSLVICSSPASIRLAPKHRETSGRMPNSPVESGAQTGSGQRRSGEATHTALARRHQ